MIQGNNYAIKLSEMHSIVNIDKRIQNMIQKRKNPMNETKIMIRKLKTEAPVLATIVDYGGPETVKNILNTQNGQNNDNQDTNQFEKIIKRSKQIGSSSNAIKKSISFIDYKKSIDRHKIQASIVSDKSPKRYQSTNSKQSLKDSDKISMPTQLKKLHEQMLQLPSVSNSRYYINGHKLSQKGIDFNNSSQLQNDSLEVSGFQSEVRGSTILDKIYKNNRKLRTQNSKSIDKDSLKRIRQLNSINPLSVRKNQKYSQSMKHIFDEINAPQLKKSNEYILARHQECQKLKKFQTQLKNRYEMFEDMGRPHKKIIDLTDCLNQFEKSVDQKMDRQLARQISKMDSRKYDLFIKHEQANRKINLLKFKQRQRNDRIQQCKMALLQSKNARDIKGNIKLNSKGHQIFGEKKEK